MEKARLKMARTKYIDSYKLKRIKYATKKSQHRQFVLTCLVSTYCTHRPSAAPISGANVSWVQPQVRRQNGC